MSTVQSTVPGPKPADNIIQQLQLGAEIGKDFLGSIQDGFKKYGDVWKLSFGSSHNFMFAHPDHYQQILLTQADKFHKDHGYKDRKRGMARFMGNGLVTSDGDFWKRQRKLIQPAFHAKRIEGYAEVMVDYTLAQMRDWRDGARLDVAHEMAGLAYKIVTKSVFDVDGSRDADRMEHIMNVFQETSNDQNSFIPTWVPTPNELRTRRAIRDVDEMFYGLIAERRAQGTDKGDLLSMLLEARDDDGTGMTDEQVRDELVTLFMAGHETTANSLNWTFVLLSRNPQVREKLHEEVDRVLAGRAPTLANLRALPYTEMVVKESMRLMPAVPVFGRAAIADVQVGDVLIPKGSSVNIFPIVTHRDPRWWGDDAQVFRPERFDPELEKQIRKYAYIPFSTGPRVCIGNSFAMMEARLLLATIVQRWTLELAPGQVVTPEALITLRPQGGLPMTAHARRVDDGQAHTTQEVREFMLA
jgi:cytochrome P450